MNADVLPFVVVDVDRCLRLRLALRRLYVGLNDVILIPNRDPLGEFSIPVGNELPPWLLVGGPANVDRNATYWMVVRSPDSAIDQGIVPLGGLFGRFRVLSQRREPQHSRVSRTQKQKGGDTG